MRCFHTDEQLLEQFVTGTRDDAEQAFESLVKRHGPVVMGICRKVLNRHQDAEDAFQATFLVLARRASAIRNRRAFSSWLYQVAHRVAIKMRYRSRLHPVLLKMHNRDVSAGEPESAAVRTELRVKLRAEVDTLPDRYRFLVVQGYLEGKTTQELARLLDRPVGTIKGWLSRARGMLRQRLSGTALEPDDFEDRADEMWRA